MTGKELTAYTSMDLEAKKAYMGLLATAGDMIPVGLKDNGVPNIGKVFLVLETGAMLGLHPMAALAGLQVIDGKAGLSAGTMSGLIRRAGHRLSFNVTGSIAGGDLSATASLRRVSGSTVDEPIEATFALDDARRAGLCTYAKGPDGAWVVRARSRNDNPLNWEKYPEDMCVARAVSRAFRRGASDLGMGAVYLVEELEEGVDVDDEAVSRAAGVAIASPVREADGEWADRIAGVTTSDELREVWEHARAQGVLADTLGEGTVRQALEARSEALKDSPGEDVAKGGISDAQFATISEWADMLEWNPRAVMAHIRKVIGNHVNDILDLTPDEAVRVIASMSAKAEQTPEPAAEQKETLL